MDRVTCLILDIPSTNKLVKAFKFLYAKSKINLIKKIKARNGLIKLKVNNYYMLVREDDKGISEDLILRGIREPAATRYFLNDMEDGMTFLEVGANIGYYTLLELKNSKNSKVIAFEPNPYNVEILKKNIEINGFGSRRIKIEELGVGDKNENMKFYIYEYSNASSMIKRDGMKEEITVKVIRLDDYITEKIDYLRMDTEGFEMNIIKGMKNILSGDLAPRKMFIEVHPKEISANGASIDEFLSLIKSYGYRLKKMIYQSSDICSGREKFAVFDNEKEFVKNPKYYEKACNIFFEKK